MSGSCTADPYRALNMFKDLSLTQQHCDGDIIIPILSKGKLRRGQVNKVSQAGK